MANPWEKYGSQNTAPLGGIGPDPVLVRNQQLKEQAAALALESANRANHNSTIANNNSTAATALAREKFDYEKKQGTMSAKDRADAVAAYFAANDLDRKVTEMKKLFAAGPGATQGLSSLSDFLPTEANKRFDRAGQSARGSVKTAYGFTSGESNTGKESSQLYDPFLPESSDYDQKVLDKIAELTSLANSSRTRSIAILGGEPDANGNITPVPADNGAPQQDNSQPIIPGAMGGGNAPPPNGGIEGSTRIMGTPDTGGGGYAPYGATTRTVNDPAMDGMEVIAGQMVANGATQQQVSDYLASNGMDMSNAKFGDAFTPAGQQWMQQNPGKAFPIKFKDPEVPMSQWEQFRNNAPQTRLGTAAAMGLNAGGFGIPQMVAGNEAFDALREQNPNSALVGDVAGFLSGGAMLGKVGTQLAKSGIAQRIAPNLLNGGKGAALTRSVAQDATQGAAFGATTEGDPLKGSFQAGAGSFLGAGVGSAVGRGLTGVTSPLAQRLNAAGVGPLTLGQIMRARATDQGGRSFIASAEDVIGNTGLMNPLVNARRAEGLDAGRLAALNIAAKPTGKTVTATGTDGIEQLGAIKNAAYNDALNGVNLPTDKTFTNQIDRAELFGTQADKARGRGDFGFIMNNELKPILSNPNNVSGKQFQDASRLLTGQGRAYQKASNGVMPDPSAMGISRALGQVGDAFTGLAARQAPQIIPKLKMANGVNRGLSVLDDASTRALNDAGDWTPAQLGQAIRANDKKFGGTGISTAKNSPLFQLQQDMQAVLPNKLPPTGVNAAPALAIGGAALSGAGVATDSDTLKYLGAMGLLATPYTKLGAKALEAGLIKRGAGVKALGSKIRKKKGLIGSGMAGFALGYE